MEKPAVPLRHARAGAVCILKVPKVGPKRKLTFSCDSCKEEITLQAGNFEYAVECHFETQKHEPGELSCKFCSQPIFKYFRNEEARYFYVCDCLF